MNQNHQAFSITNGTSGLMVLYIHGLMGSPFEFRKFLDHLPLDRVDASALLLPGHGGSSADFAAANTRIWQDYVLQQVGALKCQYKRLILIGHSMGGLLALNAARKYPIDGIILLNTPFKTHTTLGQMDIALKVTFAPKSNHDPLLQAYRDTFSVSLADWWHILAWLPKILDIQRLLKASTRNLEEIHSPVRLFQSLNDETVDPLSAELFSEHLNHNLKQKTELNHSTHAYFSAADLTLIKQGILQTIEDSLK